MKHLHKPKLSLTYLLVLVIILSGCTGGSSNKSVTDADINKGTEGIIMQLEKNAPPEKVFEDTTFPIIVSLHNKGTFDVKEESKGYISIGTEKNYVELGEEKELMEFEALGKSIFDQNGELFFLDVTAETKKVGAQSELRASTIFITACYPYKTTLGTSTCVDPDIFQSDKRKKACEVKDLVTNNGQGAPVAITKIETRMVPSDEGGENFARAQFVIHIENKGNGEVLTNEREKIKNACTSNPLGFKDFNKIRITAKLSNEELDCSIDETTEATVTLRDKKTIARCTSLDSIQRNVDAYTAPLKIELDYGYTHTISKDITIEKILKY